MKPRRLASAVISSIVTRGRDSSFVLTERRRFRAQRPGSRSAQRPPRGRLARHEIALDLFERAALRGELQQLRGLGEADPAVRVVRVFQRRLAGVDVGDEERHVHDAVAQRIVERVEVSRAEQRLELQSRLFEQLATRRIRRAFALLDAAHHERPRAGEHAARTPQQQHFRFGTSETQHHDRNRVGTAVRFHRYQATPGRAPFKSCVRNPYASRSS